MDKVSKKSEHRKSLSLTKTTYSNNPIVSITRLTDSQRGLGSVC